MLLLNSFSATQVLGTAGHERVGEEFLEGLGFPKEVTQFVKGHVQVKPVLKNSDDDNYKVPFNDIHIIIKITIMSSSMTRQRGTLCSKTHPTMIAYQRPAKAP